MTDFRPAGERARIVVAYVGFILIGISASGGGVLIPAQMTDYQVDKATIGLIFLAFSSGYVTSAFASGSLLHRFGIRACLTAGSVTMLLAWAAVALRPAFVAFVALQVIAGFGGGVLEAGLNAHLSMLDRATRLLNLLHAFFGIGALLGPVIAGAVLLRGLPWTTFYLLLAVLLTPLTALLLMRYPPTVAAEAKPRPRLTEALQLRGVWLAATFLMVYVGLEVSLGNWGFTFLTEVREQHMLLASWVMSGYWAGLTAGRLVLSRVTDRLGLGAVGLIAGCLAGAAGCSLVVWLVPGSAVAAVGFVMIGFFLGPLFPTTIAVVPRLAPVHLVATAIGVLVGLSMVGGALAPFAAGGVAEQLGIWSLLPFALLLTAALAIIWRAIARRLAPAEPQPVPPATES